MADLDKTYYRAVHKSSMDKGTWTTYASEYFQGVLDGDIEVRRWTVKGVEKSRQDWAIKNGKMAAGAGTSIHDQSGGMEPAYMWKYFTMPSGTPIPPTLKIVQRGRDAHHYQIEVANGGTLTPDALRGALDTLARACVVKEVELNNAH